MTSSFHSSSRIPFDSTLSIPYNSSPDRSPSRKSLDFPNVQPEIDPHQPNPFESLITSSFTTQDHHYQNSHSPSQSYLYSDPFSGSFKQLQGHPTNVNESFEKIHGPSNINNLLPPSAPHYHWHNSKYPKSNVQNHFISFIHVHRLSRLSLDYKRLESVQVSRMSDIGVGVDQNETTTSLPSSHNSDDLTPMEVFLVMQVWWHLLYPRMVTSFFVVGFVYALVILVTFTTSPSII